MRRDEIAREDGQRLGVIEKRVEIGENNIGSFTNFKFISLVINCNKHMRLICVCTHACDPRS